MAGGTIFPSVVVSVISNHCLITMFPILAAIQLLNSKCEILNIFDQDTHYCCIRDASMFFAMLEENRSICRRVNDERWWCIELRCGHHVLLDGKLVENLGTVDLTFRVG